MCNSDIEMHLTISVERNLEVEDEAKDTEPANINVVKETFLHDSACHQTVISQSHPHQPSTDSALSQPSFTSFTSVGVSGELTSVDSLKETDHDGKGHEATFSGTTKEAASPTESVENQLETENIATSQESLSEASQSLQREPSSDVTQGKRLSTSVGVGEEEKSVQSSSKEMRNGRTATSCSTIQQTVTFIESDKKQIKTDVETKPSVMRLTDMEAVSPLIRDDPLHDDGETTHIKPDKSSADSTKPSPSTGTSTGGVSVEQDTLKSGQYDVKHYVVCSISC